MKKTAQEILQEVQQLQASMNIHSSIDIKDIESMVSKLEETVLQVDNNLKNIIEKI